jgi:hypothetical protein
MAERQRGSFEALSLQNGSLMGLSYGSTANVSSSHSSAERFLINVRALSWFWKEHPLVSFHSAFAHVLTNLIHRLVLRSSKTLQVYVRQGRP